MGSLHDAWLSRVQYLTQINGERTPKAVCTVRTVPTAEFLATWLSPSANAWRHHRWPPTLDPTLDLVSDHVLDQKADPSSSIAMNLQTADSNLQQSQPKCR